MKVLTQDKTEVDIDDFDEYKPELPKNQEWLEVFPEAREYVENRLTRYRALRGWLEKQKKEILELLAMRDLGEEEEAFYLFLIKVYIGFPLIWVNREIRRLERYLPEKRTCKSSEKFLDVEEIKKRVDIVEVVSDYVDLKRTGKVYMGRCPFHDDRKPSFAVYPDGYKCFGCGASGDVIDFIMQIRNCDFKEALEILKEYL
jgi:hypothetical protein